MPVILAARFKKLPARPYRNRQSAAIRGIAIETHLGSGISYLVRLCTRKFLPPTACEIKKRFPECCLISDVAMGLYSSDGHDGLVREGKIVNDETLPILPYLARAFAERFMQGV
ncbi:MAG: hypothetical protein IPH12_00170 [Saprospirales bacterium]|nr:hypothetical protein [Saprospirales bacterium]